ncbi:unnamed protein product, partial [Polarella glacialis]
GCMLCPPRPHLCVGRWSCSSSELRRESWSSQRNQCCNLRGCCFAESPDMSSAAWCEPTLPAQWRPARLSWAVWSFSSSFDLNSRKALPALGWA